MKQTTFLVLGVLVAIIGGAFFAFVAHHFNSYDFNSEDSTTEDKSIMEYQGPVPEGYDEEHFRKTGETIKKEEVIN